MSTTTDLALAGICITGTARYIPYTRVQPKEPTRDAMVTPTHPAEVVMQSIYSDTLRWRGAAGRPCAPSNSSGPVPTATPGCVAIEQEVSLAEMASGVAREALQRSPCAGRQAVDQIVVCATSLEHDLALSCAGRLHSEFGSTHSPLAIGQLQGVCAFLALQIAADMMVQDERMHTALIVGAECWRAPFSRVIGSLTALGDGAAAALIRRGATSGWHVRSLTLHTPCSAGAHNERLDESLLLEVIAETCGKAKLRPSEIDWVVPARINPSLASEISIRAQLPAKRMLYPQPFDIGYLCAADPLAQLDTLLQWLVASHETRILLWSAGLQGQAACAILEFRGS